MYRSEERTHDLDVVITRGANTIGPRQFPEKAVPKAVVSFISGKAFPLYRSPARRMWLYVDDHARGVLAALQRGRSGETYNIAPEPESEAYTHDVIERVRQIVGLGEIQLVDDRKAYDLRYWISPGKISRGFGALSFTEQMSSTSLLTVFLCGRRPARVWSRFGCVV